MVWRVMASVLVMSDVGSVSVTSATTAALLQDTHRLVRPRAMITKRPLGIILTGAVGPP
jgi:hypothetical protein